MNFTCLSKWQTCSLITGVAVTKVLVFRRRAFSAVYVQRGWCISQESVLAFPSKLEHHVRVFGALSVLSSSKARDRIQGDSWAAVLVNRTKKQCHDLEDGEKDAGQDTCVNSIEQHESCAVQASVGRVAPRNEFLEARNSA